jgi:hypothetical protein
MSLRDEAKGIEFVNMKVDLDDVINPLSPRPNKQSSGGETHAPPRMGSGTDERACSFPPERFVCCVLWFCRISALTICLALAWYFAVGAMVYEDHDQSTAANNDQFLFSHIESTCHGSGVDLDYFTDLFLHPSESMGLCYLIFLLVYFKPTALVAIEFLTQKLVLAVTWVLQHVLKYCCSSCNYEDRFRQWMDGITDQAKEKLDETPSNGASNENSDVAQDTKEEVTTALAERLEAAGKGEDHDQMVKGVNLWFAILQLAVLAITAHSYLSRIPGAGDGVSWKCRSALFAALPMAKTISVPLWIVLMDVGQFAHWLLNRHRTPKQQTGIAAGSAPLHQNIFTAALMVITVLLFIAWLFNVLPELALLVLFPTTTLFYFAVQPVLVMVLLPEFCNMVSRCAKRREIIKGWKSDGVSQEFTLKIAAAQGLCAVAESISLLPYFGGTETWSHILQRSFLTAISTVPRFLRALCTLDIPSFGWPSLPEFDQQVFNFSVALAVLSYAMVPALIYYNKHLKDCGKEWCFPEEEVVLQVGEESDDLGDEYVTEVTPTGRYKLKTHWVIHTDRTCDVPKTNLRRVDKQRIGKRKVANQTFEAKGMCAYIIHLVMRCFTHSSAKQEQENSIGIEEDNNGQLVQVLGRCQMSSYKAVITRHEAGDNIEVRRVYRLWHPTWLFATIIAYGVMGPAALLSSLQRGLTALRHRGKDWWNRNYDYVTSPTVVQFVKDNPKVKVLHVAGCTNLKNHALDTMGQHCTALTVVIAQNCELSGTVLSRRFALSGDISDLT